MSKKKVLLRGVFINRDTNGEGVLKVGTTLIRVSTVMGILYYAGAEKSVILKRVKLISIIGLISLVIGLVMEAINYDSMIPIYECMKGTCLGLGVGALATMVLYTTGILEKIKNRKSKQMKIVAIFGSGIIAICIIVSLILTIVEFLS